MSVSLRNTTNANQVQISEADLHFLPRRSSSPGYPRTGIRYWREKVKRPFVHGTQSPNYGVQIAFQGKRRWFTFETGNRDQAAREAQKLFLEIKVNGWEVALAAARPKSVQRKEVPTVGSYLKEVESVAQLEPRTINEYRKAFRRLVSEVMDIDGAGRFDWKTGKTQAWREKVDRVRLSAITPTKVQQWKKAKLATAAGFDPLRQKAAKTTINAILRNSKALFGKKVLPFVAGRFELSSPLPFEGVDLFPRQSMRYCSKIDAAKVIERAYIELTKPHEVTAAQIQEYTDRFVDSMNRIRVRRGSVGPYVLTEARRRSLEAEVREKHAAKEASRDEQWKIFVLAIFAGLRFNEIDKLLWRQVDFERGFIRIEATPYFRPKTEESAGMIPIESEVVQILWGFKQAAKGEFVVEASGKRRAVHSSASYRTKLHWKALLQWLRTLEIDGEQPLSGVQKAIHELRKEAGSIICQANGLYEASRFLRHSDTRITAAHYVDRKDRVTIGMGRLLHETQVISDGT